jgi:RNA polymerase sigma-70 factor (ECF subfamily)
MKTDEMLTIQKSVTENELIKGCRKGQPKAQKALYERVSSMMLGLCMRYIHDREEAEHVMIGGMVKVFEKIRQYEGQGSFEGWIRRIMVNECLMYIRKHKNMSLEVEVEEAEREPNYENLTDSLNAEHLMELIGELPVGYRTVFNLYAIEGYNHQEIGELLGISENTSKSQLSRARKLLQTRLSEIEHIEQKHWSNHGTE